MKGAKMILRLVSHEFLVSRQSLLISKKLSKLGFLVGESDLFINRLSIIINERVFLRNRFKINVENCILKWQCALWYTISQLGKLPNFKLDLSRNVKFTE